MTTPSGNSKAHPKGTRNPHHDLRRALLDATLEELTVSGPQEISFREIARRLGVTTAAPYYHFRDKGELLFLLAVEGFARLLERLKAAETGERTMPAKIAALTRAFLNFGRKERGYYGIMFYREVVKPHNAPNLEGPAAQCFDLVCSVIAKANPALTRTKASERAVSVWSFLHGMLVLSSSGPLSSRLAPQHEDRLAVKITKRIIGI